MEKDFLKALKNFVPVIQEAKEAKRNEQDTRDRLRIMLEKVFGWDPLEDISAEFNVKGTHVDFAVKIKGEFKFFIEAKKAEDILKDHHVRQAANYAANQNVPYALLTNLSEFWVYKIEFGGPVDYIPVFKVILLQQEDISDSAELLWLLTKRAFKTDELGRYSKTMESLSDENLLSALVSENVIDSIRRELRKISDELVPRELVEKAIIARFPEEVINLIKESSSVHHSRKKKVKNEKEQPCEDKAGACPSGQAVTKTPEQVIPSAQNIPEKPKGEPNTQV